MMTRKTFNLRSFTSLYMFLSGSLITITGLVLYLAPAGRVAKWVQWRFLFFTKEQWQALHTIFSFIFLAAIALHLYYNWKPLMNYLRDKAAAGLRLKKELQASSILTVAIFVLILAEVPPLSSLMALGESLTESWATEEREPPVAHAEELTLTAFASAAGLETEAALRHLTGAGLTGVDSTITMGELAEINRTTPKALAELLARLPATREPVLPVGSTGAGYGRLTIEQIAAQENLDIATVLARLAEAGISARAEEKLRDLAEAHDRTPGELAALIRGGR